MNFFETSEGYLINLDAVTCIVSPEWSDEIMVYFGMNDALSISEKDFEKLKSMIMEMK